MVDALYEQLRQALRVFTYEADDPAFADRYIARTPDSRRTQWAQLRNVLDPEDRWGELAHENQLLRDQIDRLRTAAEDEA